MCCGKPSGTRIANRVQSNNAANRKPLNTAPHSLNNTIIQQQKNNDIQRQLALQRKYFKPR